MSNLGFEGTRVLLSNAASISEFNYLSENGKLIEDGEGNIIYDKNKFSARKTLDSRSVDTVIPKKTNSKTEIC